MQRSALRFLDPGDEGRPSGGSDSSVTSKPAARIGDSLARLGERVGGFAGKEGVGDLTGLLGQLLANFATGDGPTVGHENDSHTQPGRSEDTRKGHTQPRIGPSNGNSNVWTTPGVTNRPCFITPNNNNNSRWDNGGNSNSADPNSNGTSTDNTSSSSDVSSTCDNSEVGDIKNPTDFAKALLKRLGAPETDANIKSLVNWQRWEGDHFKNSARFNPLNTTQKAEGAGNMNKAGVKRYTSWEQGLDATVKTLNNGRYKDILAALRAGKGLGHGDLQGLRTWSGNTYSHI